MQYSSKLKVEFHQIESLGLFVFFKICNNIILKLLVVWEESCVEELVPSIRNSGEAPVATVHVVVAAVAVDGGVAVFSQLRQRGDIQQINWLPHPLQHSLHRHLRRMWAPRVLGAAQWPRFSAAVPSSLTPQTPTVPNN